jgi:hypothetical protein
VDWTALIEQLLELLMEDHVNANHLCNLLGDPVEKDRMQWVIEPGPNWAGALGEVFVHFEDLRSGPGLITTIQIRLARPWRSSPAMLERIFGSPATELPIPPATILPGGDPSPSPRTLAYDVLRNGKMGELMVTARIIEEDPTKEVEIIEITVRRYYD